MMMHLEMLQTRKVVELLLKAEVTNPGFFRIDTRIKDDQLLDVREVDFGCRRMEKLKILRNLQEAGLNYRLIRVEELVV